MTTIIGSPLVTTRPLMPNHNYHIVVNCYHPTIVTKLPQITAMKLPLVIAIKLPSNCCWFTTWPSKPKCCHQPPPDHCLTITTNTSRRPHTITQLLLSDYHNIIVAQPTSPNHYPTIVIVSLPCFHFLITTIGPLVDHYHQFTTRPPSQQHCPIILS